MNGRPWTEEEDRYLLDNYPDEDTRMICLKLYRSKSAVYGRARKRDLNKSQEAKRKYGCYLTGKEGKDFRFNKGHVPANKGKPMPLDVYKKAEPTMFKKGHISKNHLPVGSITQRNNYKRGSSYMYIKIAEPNKWKHLHRHVWELENGLIPAGMNLVFRDGNFKNCELNNLELITREENMRRNTIHNRYPEEIKRTMMTLGVLKRKLREHEERNN